MTTKRKTTLKKKIRKTAYRVIKHGARIEGVPYATPSILHLKKSVAKYHLGKKNIKPYTK